MGRNKTDYGDRVRDGFDHVELVSIDEKNRTLEVMCKSCGHIFTRSFRATEPRHGGLKCPCCFGVREKVESHEPRFAFVTARMNPRTVTVACRSCGTEKELFLNGLLQRRKDCVICETCDARKRRLEYLEDARASVDGLTVMDVDVAADKITLTCDTCGSTFVRGHKRFRAMYTSGETPAVCDKCQAYGSRSDEDIQDRLDELRAGLLYVPGTYTNAGGTLDLECAFCGEVFTRSAQVLRPAYKSGVWCPNCRPDDFNHSHKNAVDKFNEADNGWHVVEEKRCGGKKVKCVIACDICGNKRQANGLTKAPVCSVCNKKKREKKYERVCQHCEKGFMSASNRAKYCSESCSKSAAYRRKHPQVTYSRDCEECGAHFVTNQPEKKYCSSKCRKKNQNRRRIKEQRLTHGMTRHEALLRANGPYDESVTLPAVFSKYGGVCQLCGGLCDWDDHHFAKNKNGVSQKVSDARYPSVDHIIAASNGGLHQWFNVRLAHMRCNTNLSNSELL